MSETWNGKVIAGGCQCGAVRYEAHASLEKVHLCHCRMCQRAVGNAFAALAGVPKAQLKWPRAQPSAFASSSLAKRGFCGRCGTPLYFAYDDSDRIYLTIGSLDDPAAAVPEIQFGVESQLPWLHLNTDLPREETERNEKLAQMTVFQYGGRARMAKAKPSISDDAVKKATGKTWKEWFSLLDKQNAQKLAHRDIAQLLNRKYLDSQWWSQMVTVVYERARGLRELHQTADGFVANVSKTFNVSLDKLYDAWRDAASRADWLAEQGIEVTRSSVNKSMRLAWSDGVSKVLVNFYPKGKDKAQVTVDHSRLESAADVAKAKSSWKESLEKLQQELSKYG